MQSQSLSHKSLAAVRQVSVSDMIHSSISRDELREIFRHEFRTFGRDQLRKDLAEFMEPFVARVHERICRGSDTKEERQVLRDAHVGLSPTSFTKTQSASERGGVPSLPGAIEEHGSPDLVVQSSKTEKAANPARKTEVDTDSSPEATPRTPRQSQKAKEIKSDGAKSEVAKSDNSKLAKTSSRIISSHKMRDSNKHSIFHHGHDKSELHLLVLRMVNHNVFDMVVAAAILLNGLVVGIQTHILARHVSDDPPLFFTVTELVFCAVFTAELALRLYAFRLKFFTMPGMVGWNLFDFVVVVAQLLELFLEAVASSGLGFSFNLLRTLRLIRVLRIARTLRLIGELRTIVSSIVSSMKPLFWTGVLLFMIVYVLGVYVTQVVLHKRLSLEDDQKETPPALTLYWGDLVRSTFSLFQSITGGVDWDQVARPLIDHIGPEMGVLYCLFICFTMFAMLNVVTGVFIQAVIENAMIETDFRTRSQVKHLFRSLDSDNNGEITWEAFNSQIDTKEMKDFFKSIDVDISNAKNLFDLLDIDSSGSVDCDEFLEGCLRIWAPSRGYDQQMILRDVNRLRTDIEAWIADSLERRSGVAENSDSANFLRVESMGRGE